jgi:integrase
MCGLRWSDINALKWGDLQTNGEEWRLEIRMIKTRELLYLPLNNVAKNFLPEQGEKDSTDYIFALPTLDCAENTIKQWVEDAGIDKHVTFHCARHTFATLMLTQGADLYTTSKLLGHTDVKTTQIYAKIVDAKKAEAVNLLNGIF